MKGKIILGLNEEFEFYDYKISFDSDEIDYCIDINTDLNVDFETLITKPTDFDEAIDYDIEFYETNEYEDSEEMIQLLKKVKENKLQYLKEAEYIEFDFDNEEVFKYLEKNPILKTKKIILRQSFDLNNQPIEEIKQLFGKYTDNLYFKLPGNSNYISFNEYEDTMITLDIMAEEINKFEFSPLEKIVYAYDMIRNRIYQKEDSNEDYTISRDLSSSLLGKKIVCLGYARIFNALLEKIGIQSYEVFLDGVNRGHARCEIYVKDEKYGIDGVYYFDPTWDSKRKDDDNSYLLSYLFFAKTRKEMDKLDNGRYINKFFPYYSETMDIEFEDFFNEGGIENIPEELIKSINYMSRIIDHESLLKPMEIIPDAPMYGKIDKDKVISKITNLIEYFDQPLHADLLLKVLYNVRKQQYYQDPIIYPFSINDFYKIVVISDWKFEPSPEERLLSSIFGEEINEDPKRKIIQHTINNHLDRDIAQIKLSKTLRKVLDKKTNNK